MKRRKAREIALKVLYQRDVTKNDITAVLSDFWSANPEAEESIKNFAELLSRGTCEKLGFLDELISRISRNWKLERMGYVDRNILRLAAYEIFFVEEVPPIVSINEGIEISKIYGGADSPKFINGILNRVKEEREISQR